MTAGEPRRPLVSIVHGPLCPPGRHRTAAELTACAPCVLPLAEVFAEAFEPVRRTLLALGEGVAAVYSTLGPVLDHVEPQGPAERALAARRRRGTGPPPPRLDGRRAR